MNLTGALKADAGNNINTRARAAAVQAALLEGSGTEGYSDIAAKSGITLDGANITTAGKARLAADNINDSQNAIVDLIYTKGCVFLNGHSPLVQVYLFQCEFLNLCTILRTADLVLGCHLRILGLDSDRLRRIDADIDNLV